MKNSNNKVILCLATATMFLAGTINVKAQDEAATNKKGEFGLRFMPTFAKFSMKDGSGSTVKGSAQFGYGVGALLGFNFTKHVGVQVEAIYSSITQKYTENTIERKVNLTYFNIPLLLSLNSGKYNPVNFNIVGGPQIGISAGSSVFTSGNDTTASTSAVVSTKGGDLGFAYGAGIDFGLNKKQTMRLGLGYRGVFGLIDISNNNKNVDNGSYLVLDKTHISTNSIYMGFSILF